MTLDFLRRRATMCGLFVVMLAGISQACGERALDPASPNLFDVRLNTTNDDPQQLDTVEIKGCPSDMVGTYPDCYYENPPPEECDPAWDPDCGEPDPCEIDPSSAECTGDPCTADPYAAGCDPCAVDPYAEGCSPPDEGTPPPTEEPPGCELYNAYAPPNIWGSWYTIAEHIGEVTYDLSASAVGDTQLFSEVKYYSSGGWSQIPFGGSITFRTGNAVAAVSARFSGSPYGTAVNGRICSR